MDQGNLRSHQGAIAWPMSSTLRTVLTCALLVMAERVSALPQSESAPGASSAMVVSLDGKWVLAIDPRNMGREEEWWKGPRLAMTSIHFAEARETKVPWIIQDAFPGYRGVAWYWREFDAPVNPHAHGRYLLRFWAVDYLADVWLNGVHVGGHEGAGGVFVLDVTAAIKPEGRNKLAVRVLNPTIERIDGIVLAETCHYLKAEPFRPGRAFNSGGIVDSVELIVSPMVRVEDLYVRPDWKTGVIEIRANIRNAGKTTVRASLTFTVAPAAGGETLDVASVGRDLEGGDTLVRAKVKVNNHRLWQLNDPYRYRVTSRVRIEGSRSFDENSTNCGFRDFRFADGYFRLNGKRVFLKSSHTATIYPIGLHWPHDPDLARREMIQMKMMGFNAIRFFCSLPARYQLELCDELGFMIYEECFAGWRLDASPKMGERFDREVSEMIKRDRNHPCVVMWGLLNETAHHLPVFRHAVGTLPMIRSLDDTRLVMLDSGRFGGEFVVSEGMGSLSNPGSKVWEDVLSDQHPYQRVPHTAEAIHALRTLSHGEGPVFMSEGSIGSAIDLAKVVRDYEQLGAEHLEDAKLYRAKLEQFMADWKRWRLEDTFASPEDYFGRCLAMMGEQRMLSLNCIRSNPDCVGHSMTGTTDCGDAGEGVVTLFRQLKPGTVDAIFDGWYPLRWCIFVEPVQVYRGKTAHLEAVLANEDVLKPGEYPVRVQVVGPNVLRIFDKTVTVTIADPAAKPEPPFAIPMFSKDVVVDGPSGKYRFLVNFQQGGAAAGGDVTFYVADPAEMPSVDTEIVLWGEDEELSEWLSKQGIGVRKFASGAPAKREVILIGNNAAGEASAWKELVTRIARGSTAIFLSSSVFAKNNQPFGWLPLVNKGSAKELPSSLYHKDEWTKNHPIFDGLPSGGLMDYTFYREIIPDHAWVGQDVPAEVVAGATNTSLNYSAGLLTAVHNLGAGRFILNTLLIRENLGPNPVAERLLRNMLRYAARDAAKPLAPLPADFAEQLKAMGYQQ